MHLSPAANELSMTDFSRAVAGCIADWGRRAAECGGNTECLESASKQLRDCLDKAFPDSERINLQGDKVNYLLSSVFFLANRLAKASQGLAEFDKVIGSAQELSRSQNENLKAEQGRKEFNKALDEILAKYF